MTPNRFSYMHDFMRNFKEMVLYNTIVEHKNPDGLTYYDLTQIDPHIPHSRIYRAMKKLEEKGLLKKKEVISELGRPKHYYSLTQNGKERHEELKQGMLGMFSAVQQRLSEDISNIHFGNIPRPNIMRIDPAKQILDEEGSNEEKLEELDKIEKHLKECLENITEARKKLEQEKST
ncbi:MAG: helix-turn-helix transcriptional regulator [Promethearchaeota archaeon]